MNLLPAVFTAEGVDNVIHIKDYSHMISAVIMKIVIGVILYLAVNRKDVIKLRNIISYVVITIFGIIGFWDFYNKKTPVSDLSQLRNHSQAFVLYIQKQAGKFCKGRVRVHFCVENIYGRAILFFARFMPTNSFAQPFVGIISFLSINHGGAYGIRTRDLHTASVARSQLR